MRCFLSHTELAEPYYKRGVLNLACSTELRRNHNGERRPWALVDIVIYGGNNVGIDYGVNMFGSAQTARGGNLRD